MDDLAAPIVNRVAASDVETVDLAAIVGETGVASLDLAPMMHRGLVVRERDFRAAVADLDLAAFAGRHVALLVPAEALVPSWAPMLVAAVLSPVAASVSVSGAEERRAALAAERIRTHDWSPYAGKTVVLKGCGTGAVPLDAFAQAMVALQGVAAKVMFGEPCSAVPVWRRPAEAPGAQGAVRAVKPAGLPRRA